MTIAGRPVPGSGGRAWCWSSMIERRWCVWPHRRSAAASRATPPPHAGHQRCARDAGRGRHEPAQLTARPPARRPGVRAASEPSSSAGSWPARDRARWRSASRRTRRSSAAADRAGRCRSRCPRRTPSSPSRPLLPWPRSTRPSGVASGPSCVRPPWFSKPASTRRVARLELDLDRDVADQPRAVGAHRVEVDAGRPRAASRRRARRSARAAGSRRTPPGCTAPRAAAACSASRLTSARSSAQSRWSRSWPPPM